MIKVLVTNDDGIEAKGIKILAKALKSVKNVKVIVVAPDREQSTTSHSLSLHRPLRVFKKSKDHHAVNGTPVDSVYMGVSVVLKEKPDFIFSGINRGGNLGDDIHYSGTVSAAVEGGIMGIPSVAMSQMIRHKENYTMAGEFAKKLLQFLIKKSLPEGTILNVNVPENLKNLDYEITKTGKRDYGEMQVEKTDPRGRPYYWIGGSGYHFFDVKNSDCNAIVAGKISVTPIQVDMTDHRFIKEMSGWKIV